MASLNSPGTQVTIIDESTYSPAPTGSVPFIILATAENKLNAANALAQYTTEVNAGKVFLVTSQRELVNYYGKPSFYVADGTPVHGYELNEYGLLTAYSALGISDAAYIMRADIDTNQLTSSAIRPVANPAAGTLWFDTTDSKFGLFEFNAATGQFINIAPNNSGAKLLVITDSDNVIGSLPIASLGKPGDYAVNTLNSSNPVYFKNLDGDWVLVGSVDWQNSLPAALGTTSNPTVTANSTITVNGTGVTFVTTSLANVVSAINSANVTGVTAAALNSRLAIYVDGTAANSAAVLAAGTGNALSTLGILPGTYYAPALQISKHTSVPAWRATDAAPRPSGSVWFKTSTPQNGAMLTTKRWNSSTSAWVSQIAPIFASDQAAIADSTYGDPTGGGFNIPVNFVYAQSDVSGTGTYTFKFFQRKAGVTKIIGSNASPVFAGGTKSLSIQASVPGSSVLGTSATVSFIGNAATDLVTAVNNAGISYVSAQVETSGKVTITHSTGGVMYLTDGSGTPLALSGITASTPGARAGSGSVIIVSNWIVPTPTYSPSATAPFADPADGTYWYYNELEFDVMINDGLSWRGYRKLVADSRGYDLTLTDVNGPIVSASEPTTQSDGSSSLKAGDLWICTANLEDFPKLYRFNGSEWVIIDTTDHTSEDGIIFADARWTTAGNIDPVIGDVSTIASLLTSDYTDPDCPSYALYPRGTLLLNTRRSGMNVKKYTVNALSGFETVPEYLNTWVSASGNDANGVAYMGRKAQRAVITAKMVEAVSNSTELLEEVRNFNLMCAPGYPELISTLEQVNINRRETAFIIGDSPLRLPADSNSLNNWAKNVNLADDNGEDGLVTYYEYLAAYYPSAYTRDLDGNYIVMPSSYMALRTILRSDQKSYVWFAPAGPRRGTVDNATAVGYIDGQTGLFQSVGLGEGVRDTLYSGSVNPIPVLLGSGIEIYGQKTRSATTSALDRINVARLIVYLRKQLDLISRGYLFEPNDDITRKEIKNAIEKELNSVKTQRGLYDYSVVCDTTNNTPLTIDRNELWVDVAIEPVKAAEFIYIPVRIKNTGDIAAGL